MRAPRSVADDEHGIVFRAAVGDEAGSAAARRRVVVVVMQMPAPKERKRNRLNDKVNETKRQLYDPIPPPCSKKC